MVEITELLADYIEGDADLGACVALMISERSASAAVRDAFEKTLSALGLGEDSGSYVTVFPKSLQVEGGDIPLDAQMLFLLVEGLDPLCIVATDRCSSQLLAEAYRSPVFPDASARVFGRPAAVFDDLDALLQTPAGKQKAWSLFKTLV